MERVLSVLLAVDWVSPGLATLLLSLGLLFMTGTPAKRPQQSFTGPIVGFQANTRSPVYLPRAAPRKIECVSVRHDTRTSRRDSWEHETWVSPDRARIDITSEEIRHRERLWERWERTPWNVGTTAVLSGPAEAEDVTAQVARARRRLGDCYLRSLAEHAGLEGALTLRFEIESDGHVGNRSVLGSDLDHRELEDCLLQVFGDLHFTPSVPSVALHRLEFQSP